MRQLSHAYNYVPQSFSSWRFTLECLAHEIQHCTEGNCSWSFIFLNNQLVLSYQLWLKVSCKIYTCEHRAFVLNYIFPTKGVNIFVSVYPQGRLMVLIICSSRMTRPVILDSNWFVNIHFKILWQNDRMKYSVLSKDKKRGGG